MGAEFTGEWDRALKTLAGLADNTKAAVGKKIAQGIKKVERKVLDHVDAQDLDWDALDPDYAARKEQQGLSPDTLRASNQMYSNITTRQLDEFSGAVGVSRGVRTKEGDDVTDIALIHEQPDNDGTKIPARKLWEPTFDEVKTELPPDVADCIRGLIR